MTIVADTVALNLIKLWKSFIDGFIDNYKKVASSSKQSAKAIPIYNQNQWPE